MSKVPCYNHVAWHMLDMYSLVFIFTGLIADFIGTDEYNMQYGSNLFVDREHVTDENSFKFNTT